MKNNLFQCARDFSKRRIKSEREIRREIAAGAVPGFWAGNRFVIDSEAYIAQIKEECLSNSGEGGTQK